MHPTMFKGNLAPITSSKITTDIWNLLKEFDPYPQNNTEKIFIQEQDQMPLTCVWGGVYNYAYTGNITGTITGLDDTTLYYVDSRSYVKNDVYYPHGTTKGDTPPINPDGSFGPVLNWTGYKQILIRRISDDTPVAIVKYELPPSKVYQRGTKWHDWNIYELNFLDSRSKTDRKANFELDAVNMKYGANSLKSKDVNEYSLVQPFGEYDPITGSGYGECRILTVDPTTETLSQGFYIGGGGWSGDDDYEHGMVVLLDALNDRVELARFDSAGTLTSINTQAVVIPWGEWVRLTASFTKAGDQISVSIELFNNAGASLGTTSGNYTDSNFGGEYGLFINQSNASYDAQIDAFRVASIEKEGGGNREDNGLIWDDYDYFFFITGWVEGISVYADYEIKIYQFTDAEYLINTVAIETTGKFFCLTTLTGGPIDGSGVNLDKLILKAGSVEVSKTYTMNGLNRSYVPPPNQPDPVAYLILLGRIYSYDQALSLLSACVLNDWDWAQYWARGTMKILSKGILGQAPFSVASISGEPPDQYLRTGNTMWIYYALAKFYNTYNASKTSEILTEIGTYLKLYMNNMITNYWVTTAGLQQYSFKGGKGQYVVGIFDPDYDIPWCSTEHNIDAWFALNELHTMYPAEGYDAYRNLLKNALLTNFWYTSEKRAYQGITDSVTHDTAHALDCGSWYSCFARAVGETEKANLSLESILPYIFFDSDIMGTGKKGCGYTPYISPHYPGTTPGMWIEGTGGCALAFLAAGQKDMARKIIYNCFQAEMTGALKYQRGYPYSTVIDPTYEISNWSSVASTAWVILGSLPNGNGVNLFGVNDKLTP